MSDNKAVTPETLNSVMEFGHVIRVNLDGTVSDSPEQPYMEVGTYKGDDGIWHDHTELPEGWQLMNGYSGQYSYRGPHMHASEYIGGRMAEDILSTPGDYVVMEVSASCGGTEDDCTEDDCNCEPESWAVAFKPLELKDHGFIALGKYSSARDSILHFLCQSEWSNDSFGDVEAPTGYVWRISNDPADVATVNTEFSSVLEEWLEFSPEVTDSHALRAELVGHFLVTEDSNGFISVTEYPTAHLLTQAYDSLESIYTEWLGNDDDA